MDFRKYLELNDNENTSKMCRMQNKKVVLEENVQAYMVILEKKMWN